MEHYVRCLMIMLCISQRKMNEIRIPDIPEDLYELCPYSNICNKTASRTFDKNIGVTPCCSSCSCSKDCGLQLNCCYDHLDRYKLIESGRIKCQIQIVGPKENVTEYTNGFGYHMVQQCATDRSATFKEPDQCRFKDEFGNSLLAPVSSLENNMIYINKQCADCNKVNVNKLQQWNYLYISSFYDNKRDLTTEIEQFANYGLGMVIFQPPKNQDWSHRRCYNKFVEYEGCRNMRNDGDWLDVCRKFRLPFQHIHQRMYRNAVCLLCTFTQINSIGTLCNVFIQKGSLSSFSVLIDSSKITLSKLLQRKTLNEDQLSETICSTEKKNSKEQKCLSIYCPEGMIKTVNGCKYFALKWYVPLMLMKLSLKPDPATTLTISTLHSIAALTNPLTWLLVPCRQIKLTTLEIAYSTGTSYFDESATVDGKKDIISSLKVVIYKRVDVLRGINPSVAIPIFQRCLRNKWKAVINNLTIIFKAEFYNGNDRYDEEENSTMFQVPQRQKYTFFTEGPAIIKQILHSNGITLMKPFFCKQVHIPQSDVEVVGYEIRIMSRNITLGNNDYMVKDIQMHSSSVGNKTYSVCIDDYDPNILKNSEISIHEKIFHFQLMSYFTLLHVYKS